MSNPLPTTNDEGPWDDPDVRRAEFRRRLAQKGIFVGIPKTGQEWVPPIPLPVSADEASEMVIRMRRGED